MIETLEPILKEHPFFKDLAENYFKLIVGCASNTRVKMGEIFIKEGDTADKFYLVRHGSVAIDIMAGQERPITIQTVRDGDILGWSWLIPPHYYRFNCRALEDTRLIALDGKCLREKCEKDHELGYELYRRLALVFTRRLEQTRMQLLDVYYFNLKGHAEHS